MSQLDLGRRGGCSTTDAVLHLQVRPVQVSQDRHRMNNLHLAGKDKPGQPLSKPLSGEGALYMTVKWFKSRWKYAPLSGKVDPHIDLLSSLILLSLHLMATSCNPHMLVYIYLHQHCDSWQNLYDLLQLSIRHLVDDGEQGGHHSVLWCLHTPK